LQTSLKLRVQIRDSDSLLQWSPGAFQEAGSATIANGLHVHIYMAERLFELTFAVSELGPYSRHCLDARVCVCARARDRAHVHALSTHPPHANANVHAHALHR
jgi:hypothetical protein